MVVLTGENLSHENFVTKTKNTLVLLIYVINVSVLFLIGSEIIVGLNEVELLEQLDYIINGNTLLDNLMFLMSDYQQIG